MSLEQWIQGTMSGMFHAFVSAREYYSTPLAHVIYWMPRVAPLDNAAIHMAGDAMNYWTIPVKDPQQLWDRASVSLYLRTDQVAHWLHISMQDLVGFLTLCSVSEITALNMYLNFRLHLMSVMNGKPHQPRSRQTLICILMANCFAPQIFESYLRSDPELLQLDKHQNSPATW